MIGSAWLPIAATAGLLGYSAIGQRLAPLCGELPELTLSLVYFSDGRKLAALLQLFQPFERPDVLRIEIEAWPCSGGRIRDEFGAGILGFGRESYEKLTHWRREVSPHCFKDLSKSYIFEQAGINLVDRPCEPRR